MSGGNRNPAWKKNGASESYQGYHGGRGAQQKDGKYWDYWQGSWSSPRGARSTSDRYDAVMIPDDKPQPLPSTGYFAGEDVPASAPPAMKEIQKYLTQAQRADTKLRKLREEQDKKSRMWAAYEKMMKQKFARQRRAFEADLQRIAKDAQEAAEHGQQAAMKVKEVALTGFVARDDPMEEDSAAWEALISGEREEPMQDGFLKVALQATKTGPTLQDVSVRPVRAPPVTDPRQTVTAVATGQPGAVVPPQASAPAPPGLHGLAPEASARPYAGTGHAAPYSASPSGAYQKRKASVSPRVNPYETTRLAAEGKPMPGEVPLEARLAATRALKAFHVKTVPPVEANTGAENGKPPTAFVNDDEEDEELDKTDRPRDPGSLGMD